MNLSSLLLSASLLFSLSAAAQQTKAVDSAKIFTYIDELPRPSYNLNEYLGANIHYPDSARAHDIEGRVMIKFVVNKKGKITQCTVLRGIGWGCDEEALRVVSGMPPWTPGKKDGKHVSVYFTLPISFKLED